MKKIVGIHQPNFFPWLGYFRKISLCDHFIFLDDVQLNKESYTRRVEVRHPFKTDGKIWLTVPLLKMPNDALINQYKIDHTKNWIEQHVQILTQSYENTPHWNNLESWLFKLYQSFSEVEFLSELNRKTIIAVCELLGTSIIFLNSSDMKSSGVKDEYTYNLVQEINGTHYVRGKGEQNYSSYAGWQDISAPHLIDLDNAQWMSVVHEKLPKHNVGTSILDALVNHGMEKVKELIIHEKN